MTARVLIAEDEAIAAMAISLMLESRGSTVLGVASTGQEAIDLASELHPDLVLMDIRLKGGMSARLHIPIIFTTAYSADEIRATCVVDEGFLFVTKPIHEGELARAIATAINRS